MKHWTLGDAGEPLDQTLPEAYSLRVFRSTNADSWTGNYSGFSEPSSTQKNHHQELNARLEGFALQPPFGGTAFMRNPVWLWSFMQTSTPADILQAKPACIFRSRPLREVQFCL